MSDHWTVSTCSTFPPIYFLVSFNPSERQCAIFKARARDVSQDHKIWNGIHKRTNPVHLISTTPSWCVSIIDIVLTSPYAIFIAAVRQSSRHLWGKANISAIGWYRTNRSSPMLSQGEPGAGDKDPQSHYTKHVVVKRRRGLSIADVILDYPSAITGLLLTCET